MSKRRAIYVILGSCGHSHALEIDFDLINYWKTQGEMPLKIREVELHSGGGVKIDTIIFDEYADAPDVEAVARVQANTKAKSKLAKREESR